jgi:hypothetical protein
MVGAFWRVILGGYEKKGACSAKDARRILVTRLSLSNEGTTAFES